MKRVYLQTNINLPERCACPAIFKKKGSFLEEPLSQTLSMLVAECQPAMLMPAEDLYPFDGRKKQALRVCQAHSAVDHPQK